MNSIEERMREKSKTLVDNSDYYEAVELDDAIRIAKEYAEEMCKKQKKLCAESIHNLDWNVMNNDIDAHEALSAILATPYPPTDKEGETTLTRRNNNEQI